MEDLSPSLAGSARARLAAVAAVVAISSACSPPPPRSYDFFLSDSIARDGTLARCDRDPVAAQTDIECANARHAALAVQLEEERERRALLERESAAKIEALRREFEAQRAAREAAAQAEQESLSAVPPPEVTDGQPVESPFDQGAAGTSTAAFDASGVASGAEAAGRGSGDAAVAAESAAPQTSAADASAIDAATAADKARSADIPRAFRADE